MLEYDKIDVSEGININETKAIFIIGILKIMILNMNYIFPMAVMI